ncbi:VUT family protein [Candidatus Viadribacter manganicus]|uniref:VUT family protein n=1 Tax=Candidatus Viadribacter manganicus TaxID=1759059 RepID=UPI000B201501|nr:VUT family protein [Candidatus Viadribacter manganicus]
MEAALTFLQQPHIAIPIVVVTVVAIFLTGRRWTALYVGLMPVINWAFAGISTIPIPEDFGGGSWHPFTVITGLVLVVRDFAQREIKHWIFGAMLIGLALSTLTAWPVIVVASGVAFLVSETADWAVYTFSRRPLSQRIMISSLISAPVDQVLFIYLASLVVPGIFAWGSIVTGIISKLIGAYFVSRVVAAQEQRRLQNDMNPT